MKKYLILAVLAICLAVGPASLQVNAGEIQKGTTVTTQVPDSHTVKIAMEGNGMISVNDVVYRKSGSIAVDRLAEQQYIIVPEKGWRVKSVRYGAGENMVEVSLENGVYTAPALNEDKNTLAVVFEKLPYLSAKTGDVLIPAAGGMIALMFLVAMIIWLKSKSI